MIYHMLKMTGEQRHDIAIHNTVPGVQAYLRSSEPYCSGIVFMLRVDRNGYIMPQFCNNFTLYPDRYGQYLRETWGWEGRYHGGTTPVLYRGWFTQLPSDTSVSNFITQNFELIERVVRQNKENTHA